MNQFPTIKKLDSAILYTLELASSLSIIEMWQGNPALSSRGGIATARRPRHLAILLSVLDWRKWDQPRLPT